MRVCNVRFSVCTSAVVKKMRWSSHPDNPNITSTPRLKTGFGPRGPLVQTPPRDSVLLAFQRICSTQLPGDFHKNLPTSRPQGDFPLHSLALCAGVLIVQNRAPIPIPIPPSRSNETDFVKTRPQGAKVSPPAKPPSMCYLSSYGAL